jgi:hypothetical protein
MPETLARLVPLFRPSRRKIAVRAIAEESYDQGWKDREAVCLTEHAHVPAPAQPSAS